MIRKSESLLVMRFIVNLREIGRWIGSTLYNTYYVNNIL